MIDILNFNSFYLVGIKGVAMTSMAQLLADANKKIAGSDVEEKFVTQEILDKLGVKIDFNFSEDIPPDVDCVIYTAAHQALNNPQVKQALDKKIPVVSQAEAVASLFNRQSGVAVCGVGGKSTVSAMISWVLNDLNSKFSFSVGVGNIPGINKTGQWDPEAKHFIIEADEYVINPQPKEGEKIIPRFSFLKPEIITCINLKFDHPDVYKNFAHTKQVYNDFFNQIKPRGKLIANYDDLSHIEDSAVSKLTFGEDAQATLHLNSYQSKLGQTLSKFSYQNKKYDLKLKLPGKYNVINALATILTVTQLGVDPQQAANSLSTFASTKRRFEFIGEKNQVNYYDDYAHHPHEVKAAIAALADWYPQQRKVIAFQSHTYSRTKELFDDFIDSFADADEVVMIDIFSSAREKADLSVSSDKLCETIGEKYHIPAKNLKSVDQLAKYCKNELNPGDVFITLGAGDIYQVHDLV